MGSRFVRTDWGPNDIALLNHEMDRLSKEINERPIIVEQEFTSSGLTPVRHSLGVKVKGVMVLSGNIQEPSAQDRDTWDRDTVRLRCDGTFPQNVVLALWGTGDERFQRLVGAGANQGTSGQVAVMDSDNTNVEFIDQSTLVSGSAPATHATSHLPDGVDPIDWRNKVLIDVVNLGGSFPTPGPDNVGCLAYYNGSGGGFYASDGVSWNLIAARGLASTLALENLAGGFDIDFEGSNGPINVLFENLGSLPSYTGRRYFTVTNQLYGPKGVGSTYMPMSFPPSTAARMMLMGGS